MMTKKVPINLLTSDILHVASCILVSRRPDLKDLLAEKYPSSEDEAQDAHVLVDFLLEQGLVTPKYDPYVLDGGRMASAWERHLASNLHWQVLGYHAASILHLLENHLPAIPGQRSP